MGSKANEAFNKNIKDIRYLLDVHDSEKDDLDVDDYRLEVLNKSAIVLMVAFWEAYCWDIAIEALEHIIKHAEDSNELPPDLKKVTLDHAMRSKHNLVTWDFADKKWRERLIDYAEHIKGNMHLIPSTPHTKNVNNVFNITVGMKRMSNNWKLSYREKEMIPEQVEKKLNRLVLIRNTIAHGGDRKSLIRKSHVEGYFMFIKKLKNVTGGKVSSHVKTITGTPLWIKSQSRTKST